MPDSGGQDEFNEKQYDVVMDRSRQVFVYGVSAAEAVVMERGLAEQYGEALALECGMQPIGGAGGPITGDADYVRGADVAKLATAPLPARIRALAAVVRANP